MAAKSRGKGKTRTVAAELEKIRGKERGQKQRKIWKLGGRKTKEDPMAAGLVEKGREKEKTEKNERKIRRAAREREKVGGLSRKKQRKKGWRWMKRLAAEEEPESTIAAVARQAITASSDTHHHRLQVFNEQMHSGRALSYFGYTLIAVSYSFSLNFKSPFKQRLWKVSEHVGCASIYCNFSVVCS